MAMREKTFKARCRTDLEDTLIPGGLFNHDHVEEEDRIIKRQALRQTCKQKAVAEPCEQVLTVLVLYKIKKKLAAGQGRAVKIYAQM